MRFERSLVVLKNYLGDTVMASPLVRSVAAISDATDALCAPMVEQLLRYPDFKVRFYDPGNLSNVSQLMRMSKQVREGRYEVAFVVNRSFRSALLVRLAGIKKCVGHTTEGRGWLLTHRIPYDRHKNEADCYLDLLKPLSITPEFTVPELYVTPEERAQGKELLVGATVGIQPGARHEYKQVPIPVWREIGQMLARQGRKVAFFGGPEERRLLGELQFDGVDLVGKTTLRETMAAVSGLDLMIGGDTGVMHVAAAVGTPTITAFGSTAADKWGWYSSPHQVIQAPDGDMTKLQAPTLTESVERALCVSR